jgi:carbohydrate kinase (thermoresistant glucokinase family)
MGVSGSGKTTIGETLSAQTGIPFFDADDFHPIANREKLKAGQPLNDEDRQDWLFLIRAMALRQAKKEGAIIACSALKEKYRELLTEDIMAPVHWVFLQGDYDLIMGRLKERKNHFMPPSLLQSQFDTLEKPENALVIDISFTPAEIVAKIRKELTL